MGALGLFALGTVGYFWYEMQPKNNYKIPTPSAQPAGPPPAAQAGAPPPAVPPAAEPTAPAAATVTPPTGTQPEAVTKAAGAAPAAGAPVAAAPATNPENRDRTPVARRTDPAVPAATAAPGDNGIKIKPARAQLDPALEAAYQAFNAGNLERAREAYQQVLGGNPDSRDALLGLAAVSMQAKQYGAAESYYTRLLELDPRDALAQAGLIGLKGQINPVSAESRLKNMIAVQPEATFLNFSLGNQYAAQGRWVEAQQAYFRAYTGDPEHPDFAYNLAVSLDQMHQTKEALEYYRRALALAESRPVSFDRAQVSKRVAQLAH
jgi:Tfp pilus assembly protein PilF